MAASSIPAAIRNWGEVTLEMLMPIMGNRMQVVKK